MEKFSNWEGISTVAVEPAIETELQPNIEKNPEDLVEKTDEISKINENKFENKQGVEALIPGTIEATLFRNQDGTISVNIGNMTKEEVVDKFGDIEGDINGKTIQLTALNQEQIAHNVINELLRTE